MSQCFPWARYNRLYQVAMSHQVRAMGCAPALKQTGPINKGQESQTRDRWSEKQKAYMQLALEQVCRCILTVAAGMPHLTCGLPSVPCKLGCRQDYYCLSVVLRDCCATAGRGGP